MTYEGEKIGELEFFSLEKMLRRDGAGLMAVHKYTKDGYKENGNRLFCEVKGDWSMGLKLQEWKFKLDIR